MQRKNPPGYQRATVKDNHQTCPQLHQQGPARTAGKDFSSRARHVRQCLKVLQPREAKVNNMKTFALVFVCLILAAVCTDANPIMKESVAKQLFRSKRQDKVFEVEIMIARCWEQESVPVMV
ncbi:unnamed protein product [Gadus morhua 'NCC']